MRKLQWGHGLGAVDTNAAFRQVTGIAMLQWGHGLGAVDTRRWRPAKEMQQPLSPRKMLSRPLAGLHFAAGPWYPWGMK